MPLRLATYNVEWFNTLFDDRGALIMGNSWSGRWDVTKEMQTNALGAVFAAMDADAVMVIEAPDNSRNRHAVTALETFAAHFGLRTSEALVGFPNDTQQEIALLYDPARVTARHVPGGTLGDPDDPRFDEAFRMDIDVDAAPDLIRWSKPPLEVALTVGDVTLNLIGVHAKSKAPHGATRKDEIMAVSIANRRKQLAQCVWLRARVDQVLARGEPLIVMGDFNDGPGLDEYEKLFGRSGVEIVLGDGGGPRLFDPHAQMALGQRIGVVPATARFKRKGQPYLSALLDYIMVSPDLMAASPAWQILHPFDHPACYDDPVLCNALLTASDHFPVVLDLAVGATDPLGTAQPAPILGP